jgi:hypothetical protein
VRDGRRRHAARLHHVHQARPIEAMRSASITTSREVARRARIRAKAIRTKRGGASRLAARSAPSGACALLRLSLDAPAAHSVGLPRRKSGTRRPRPRWLSDDIEPVGRGGRKRASNSDNVVLIIRIYASLIFRKIHRQARPAASAKEAAPP